jgi:hypothetical protein
MRAHSTAKSRDIYVPPYEVEAYACGWRIADCRNSPQVLMLPPVVSGPPKNAEAHMVSTIVELDVASKCRVGSRR